MGIPSGRIRGIVGGKPDGAMIRVKCVGTKRVVSDHHVRRVHPDLAAIKPRSSSVGISSPSVWRRKSTVSTPRRLAASISSDSRVVTMCVVAVWGSDVPLSPDVTCAITTCLAGSGQAGDGPGRRELGIVGMRDHDEVSIVLVPLIADRHLFVLLPSQDCTHSP